MEKTSRMDRCREIGTQTPGSRCVGGQAPGSGCVEVAIGSDKDSAGWSTCVHEFRVFMRGSCRDNGEYDYRCVHCGFEK